MLRRYEGASRGDHGCRTASSLDVPRLPGPLFRVCTMSVTIPPYHRWVLDPRLALRADVDRDVLISRPSLIFDRNYVKRLLEPAEAIILCLLDGTRTVRDTARLWSELTRRPEAEGLRDVLTVIDYYTGEQAVFEVLVDADTVPPGHIRRYDPAHLVVPVQNLNLTDRRLRIPYRIHFLPTLRCPQHCVYCYAKVARGREPHLLEVDQIRDIVSELRRLGVDALELSGGEVFTHPRVFDLLEAIVACGIEPQIPTKFHLDYETAVRLRDLGINTIQFSLDSVDEILLDQILGVPGFHRRALTTLENLRRAGLSVRVNTVLMPTNAPLVGDLVDYVGRLGNVLRLSLSPYGRSLFHHDDRLFVGDDMIDAVNDVVEARRAIYPHMRITVGSNGAPDPATPEDRQIAWQGRAHCSGNRDGFVILPDGRVTVCEELYDHPAFIIGDLTRQAVMEVWRSPEALALLHSAVDSVPDGACRGCSSFAECHAGRGRCWRDVLKVYGWERHYWPDPRCPRAPAGNRLR